MKDTIERNQNLYNCNKGQNNKFGRAGTKMNFAKKNASLTSACAGGERNEGGIQMIIDMYLGTTCIHAPPHVEESMAENRS